MPHVNAKVTAVAAAAPGMSAASAALPRKWEGVDPALERMVLRACLDQAPERRRVREAFKDVQLNIDHCLFKVCAAPFPFLPFPERCYGNGSARS
jgi:acylglycerol lipase